MMGAKCQTAEGFVARVVGQNAAMSNANMGCRRCTKQLRFTNGVGGPRHEKEIERRCCIGIGGRGVVFPRLILN